ncbi:MAG: LytTR family DNA-binding domain-containing protein [Caulobacter sp.]|nr:LytTR family DNA-binding domain-containing protein [Caulobacter sp.]
MTSGADTGTNGAPSRRRVFLRGAAVYASVVLVVTLINVMSLQHEMPELAWWKPWTWEGSSLLIILTILWLPWLTLQAGPVEAWRRPRTWMIHLGGMLAWSILHVGGFLILRHGVYALAGEAYNYGDLDEKFLYEARKDILSYTMAVATFWVAGRMVFAPQAGSAAPPPLPATFDIRDGGRVIRVPAADILAVASAGNYVEVHLADGRKPLMRSALSAVEADLADKGFVRTHRSWLVNAARVTGLKPEGSGDWTVELGALEAPLSRRFPDALARLRGGG